MEKTGGGDMKLDKQLELYLHIPFCVKKCDYCDFLSAPADEKTQNHYMGALLKEIRYYARQCQDYEVTTIYIGGGTPSWLQESYMELIMKQIQVSYQLCPEAEITIECNPGTLNKEKLFAYKKVGINRLSIGLQSTMNDELQELGRIHTYEQFLHNYEVARQCGFTNMNIDLMSALPYQSVEKYMTSLKRVIALKPEHISAYTLIIEKGTPFYDKYKFDVVKREAGMPTEQLPSEETEYQIYKCTQKELEKAGYHHYEISNYAKTGYECRHNIGYWKRADYLGFGLGAASMINNVRYTNETDIYAYMKATEQLHKITLEKEHAVGEKITIAGTNLHSMIEPIDRKAQMEEYMFLGLRMTDGITRTGFADMFGVQIEAIYYEVIQKLKNEKLIMQKAGRISLTDKGSDISNYVLAEFLMD